MMPVPNSGDLRRVLALPRRDWQEHADQLALDLTSVLRTPRGEQVLRPVQAAMLAEAYEQRGLIAAVGVGWGKTLVSILVAVVLEVERPLLLVPAALRIQTFQSVLPMLEQHWRMPWKLAVHSYSELSTVRGADLLERLQPDLVISDEVHMLKNRKAARTRRFLRYFREHPETLFVGLSGTVTKDSLFDYQHLALLALHDRAPVPKSWSVCRDWDDALAVRDDNPNGYERSLAPGALMQLVAPEDEGVDEKEVARKAYRQRLVQTPGWVATSETDIGSSLVIVERPGILLPPVEKALAELDNLWVTPGGEEVESALHLAAHAKELALGFYYRWEWPGGQKDQAWLKARAEWHRFVRAQLGRGKRGLDSPLQVAHAIRNGELPQGVLPLCAWQDVDRGTGYPPTVPAWLTYRMVGDIMDWAATAPGIVWVFHDALGMALKKHCDRLPYYGAGEDEAVLKIQGHESVALSAAAHGTGKNLQCFNRALFTSTPSSAVQWEQLIGRMHRFGQQADEVRIDVYQHTEHLRLSMASAIEEAQYIEQTTGQKQKLLFARMVRAEEIKGAELESEAQEE